VSVWPLEQPVKPRLLWLALVLPLIRLRQLWPPLILAAGLPLAALASSTQPKLMLGAGVAACAVTLAFRHPTANLILVVMLTAVVPYEALNRFSVAGGTNSPGLLLSDVLLVAGLAWAVLTLPSVPIDRRRLWFAVAVAGFMAVVLIQFIHGVRAGYVISIVGQETRALVGIGTFLIALPILTQREASRRLFAALAIAAMILGAWGMMQWFGHVGFGSSGDVGVRPGVAGTTAGTGQLQGGEFAYPVAIILCFAVLAYGGITSRLWRGVLLAAIVLNSASCLVTFERSFWLDALAGLGFVVLFTGAHMTRVKVFAMLTVAAALALVTLSLLAPAVLTTAHQRLESIGGYSTDDSVRYRLVESGFVYSRVRAHPLVGSGLGATIFWGQPWAQVPPTTRNYSHDGYLWLAWKTGLPCAALLVGLLALAVIGGRARGEDMLSFAVRRGAQGSIVGLLIATVTFPSFSQLSIAPVIGVLLALAVSPTPAQHPYEGHRQGPSPRLRPTPRSAA
jgi:hypothetical protein